jgi:type IV pilus assembly protein PilB
LRVEEQQLKSFIIDKQILSAGDLNKAVKEAKENHKGLEDWLVEKKYISQESLEKLKAYILAIPFIDLEKEDITHEVLNLIPEAIARRHNIIAYRKVGKDLEVAMADPTDLQTIEMIKKKTGLRILPRLTSEKNIKLTLKLYQKTLEAEFGEIIKKGEEGEMTIIQGKPADEESMSQEDLAKLAEDLPIVRIVDTLIKHAILQDATDIHIEPTEKEVVVRYRVDGILHDAMTLPPRVISGIVARIKVLSNLKLDEHRLPQDGRFKIETEDYRIAFRISVMPVADGEKIVMRILHEDTKGITLEWLGFIPDQIELIHRNLKKTTGLLLATGPTGSGKTTTLYTMIDIINKPGVNIMTIEEPIEYRMPRINQTQVNPKIGLTFASGLRSIVRQDPDIIMVGEIRDNETAALAVNAALTGHLVLSTLHTNSASGAFPRLLDMDVEPFLIASTVSAAVGQRLIRTLCEEKESYNLSQAEVKSLREEFDLDHILETMKKEKAVPQKATWETITFYKAKPTRDCPDGYKGRVGIHEVLIISDTIQQMITKHETSDEIEKQARKEGMVTMLEDGFIKAVRGLTSLEEILRVIRSE